MGVLGKPLLGEGGGGDLQSPFQSEPVKLAFKRITVDTAKSKLIYSAGILGIG